MSNENNSKPHLQRKLGLWSVIAIGVGTTIGTGIFSTFSEIAGIAGSSLILLLAFVLGGLLQIPSSFCFAELSSAYPEDGAHYVYLRETGAKYLAFLSGWVSFWATDPPSVSIMAIGLINYLAVLLPIDMFYIRLIAVSIVLILMFLHIRTVKGGGIFQTFITTIKVLPFIIIIGVGAFFIKENPIDVQCFNNWQIMDFGSYGWLYSLLAATCATSLAYDGIFAPCYMSGEFKNAKKVLPIGLISTAVLILVLYSGLTFVSTGLLGIDELASNPAPMAEVASQIPFIGEYAGVAVAIMAVLVIIGSISSGIMYQPRIEYAMAKDGYFFKAFGKLHKKYNTPYFAIICHGVMIISLTFVGNLSDMLGYYTLIQLVKNALAVGTIFYLRKKEGYNPSYICPLGNVFPIVSLVVSGILVLAWLISAPILSTTFAILMALSGLPAFYIWTKLKDKKEEKITG